MSTSNSSARIITRDQEESVISPIIQLGNIPSNSTSQERLTIGSNSITPLNLDTWPDSPNQGGPISGLGTAPSQNLSTTDTNVSSLIKISNAVKNLSKSGYAVYLYTLADKVTEEHRLYGSLIILGIYSSPDKAQKKCDEVQRSIIQAVGGDKHIGVTYHKTGEWDILRPRSVVLGNRTCLRQYQDQYQQAEQAAKERDHQIRADILAEFQQSQLPGTLANYTYHSYSLLGLSRQLEATRESLRQIEQQYQQARDQIMALLAEHPNYQHEWQQHLTQILTRRGEEQQAQQLAVAAQRLMPDGIPPSLTI